MYEQFYGLSRTPFAVTPDPLMLFMSRVHREALATIIYGVETRKGFIVCTGEVGTGKSTIIRAFFDQATADAVKLIYIFTPQVTPFEMARFICGELDLEEPESVFAAVPRLQLKLLEVFESGRTVVLMIDEAQLLPAETLEFLRLLSNFETDTEKLIQIVLVGQPEVDTMLARRDMRQVNQRVALRARLGAFSIEESFDYIDHRLRVAGAGEMTQVMSASAAWLIAEAADGIPRRINILADNALIAGFGAAQRPLGSQIAGTAVREFLAKSGGATSPARDPAGAGWSAARRLRNALAREKEEPAEWVSAVPPGAAAAAASPPRRAGPPAGIVIRPAGPPPARPTIRHGLATAAVAAAGIGPTVIATAAPKPPTTMLIEPEPAGLEALPPVAKPIAAPGIAGAAPGKAVAPQWIAFSDDATEWIGFEPVVTRPDPPPPARAPAAPAAPVDGAAAPVVAATSRPTPPGNGGRPDPAGPIGRWPALSRVRTDLEAAARRAPLRAAADRASITGS